MATITKRIAAAAVALSLAGAGALVTQTAAQAHTGDVKASAVCNTQTGQYDVTYTLTLKNAPSDQTAVTKWRVGARGFEGTPTSDAGLDRGPLASSGNATVALGTHALPGTTKTGPWIYAFTRWSGGYGYGSDTRVEGLRGDCKIPTPPVTEITVPDLTVLPPSCDVDGTLPFLGNPPAQNANGYEFPGQGFRVYLDKPFTGPGAYVATLQKVGAGFDPAFPGGTKITGGNVKQALTVLPKTGTQSADPAAPCFERFGPPVTPEPKRTEEPRDAGTPKCGDTTVATLTTWTETTFGWTWNEGTKEYEPTAASSTGTIDGVRDLEQHELDDLAEACHETPVTPPATPEEPTPPAVTPDAPTAPQKPVSAPVTPVLASTGTDVLSLSVAGVLLALGGLALALMNRRSVKR